MMLLKIKSKLKWPVTFARHYALSCRSHQIISRNGIKLSVLIVISMKLTFGKRENVKYKKQLACTMWSSRSWTPLLANLLINCLFSSVSAISYMCYPCYLIKQISPSYYFFISFINSPFLQVDLLWDIEDDQSNRCTQLWSLRAALAFRGEKIIFNDSCQSSIGQVHVLLTRVRFMASQNWSPENAAFPPAHSLHPPLKQHSQVERQWIWKFLDLGD